MIVREFTLKVIGPDEPEEPAEARKWDSTRIRVSSNLPAVIEAAEEDLSDLLPDGYQVVID